METERERGREERPDQVLETRWETRGGLGGKEAGWCKEESVSKCSRRGGEAERPWIGSKARGRDEREKRAREG